MDAKQWIEFETAARNNTWATILKKNPNAKRGNDTAIPVEFSDPEWLERIGKGTDWEDVLLRTALTHNAQISASGGSEKTQFMLSAGYLNQEGVVIENDYNRLSLRSNVNHQFNERLNASVKIALTRSNDSSYGTAGKSDAVSLALQSDPIFPLRVETGSLGFKDPQSMWNTFDKYYIMFQVESNEYFTTELDEYKNSSNWQVDSDVFSGRRFKFIISEVYTEPSYWDMGYDTLGDWSASKEQRVNNLMGWTHSDWLSGGSSYSPVQYGRLSYAAKLLRKELQALADAGTPVVDDNGSYMQLAAGYEVDYSAYE